MKIVIRFPFPEEMKTEENIDVLRAFYREAYKKLRNTKEDAVQCVIGQIIESEHAESFLSMRDEGAVLLEFDWPFELKGNFIDFLHALRNLRSHFAVNEEAQSLAERILMQAQGDKEYDLGENFFYIVLQSFGWEPGSVTTLWCDIKVFYPPLEEKVKD